MSRRRRRPPWRSHGPPRPCLFTGSRPQATPRPHQSYHGRWSLVGFAREILEIRRVRRIPQLFNVREILRPTGPARTGLLEDAPLVVRDLLCNREMERWRYCPIITGVYVYRTYCGGGQKLYHPPSHVWSSAISTLAPASPHLLVPFPLQACFLLSPPSHFLPVTSSCYDICSRLLITSSLLSVTRTREASGCVDYNSYRHTRQHDHSRST